MADYYDEYGNPQTYDPSPFLPPEYHPPAAQNHDPANVNLNPDGTPKSGTNTGVVGPAVPKRGYDLEAFRKRYTAPGVGSRVSMADLQKFLNDNQDITYGVTLKGEKAYDPTGRYIADLIGNFKSGDPNRMTRIFLDGIGSNGKPRPTGPSKPRPPQSGPGYSADGIPMVPRPMGPQNDNYSADGVLMTPRPGTQMANDRPTNDTVRGMPGGTVNDVPNLPRPSRGSVNDVPNLPKPPVTGDEDFFNLPINLPQSPTPVLPNPDPTPAANPTPGQLPPGQTGQLPSGQTGQTGQPGSSIPGYQPSAKDDKPRYDAIVYDMIQKMLKRGSEDVTEDTVRGQFGPASVAMKRNAERSKMAAAERAAFQGTNIGGAGGPLDSEMRGIDENLGESEGKLMAQLIGDEIRARRGDLESALQFAQGEERNALTMQIAEMDAELRKLGINTQDRQFNQSLNQQDKQFKANIDLQYKNLSQQDRQFMKDLQFKYSSLNQQQKQFLADLKFREKQLTQQDKQFLLQLAQQQSQFDKSSQYGYDKFDWDRYIWEYEQNRKLQEELNKPPTAA